MILNFARAGSLNQGTATATASSEPSLKAAHLIVFFKRKNVSVELETLRKHPLARWQ